MKKKTSKRPPVKTKTRAVARRPKAARHLTTPKKAAAATAPRGRVSAPATIAAAAAEAGDILVRLDKIHALLTRAPDVRASLDAALESGVDSLRRLLSEIIQAHTDGIAARLASIRTAAAGEPSRLARELDNLMEDLGAIRFTAEPTEQPDPLIHQVVEERLSPKSPAGTILENIRPGYRTVAGKVLAKASVAISRKD